MSRSCLSSSACRISVYFYFFLIGLLFFPLVAPAATITVLNLGDSGEGSLRKAILDAMPGDKIKFHESLNNPPDHPMINLTNGALVINKDLEICGFYPFEVVLSGGALDRVIEITSGATVSLTDLQFENGQAPAGQSGGGILNEGNLTVLNCSFENNRAGDTPGGTGGNGGAIANTGGGSLTITTTRFENNSAGDSDTGGNGGAVFTTGGTVMISQSFFQENSAGNGTASNGGNGGGVYSDGGNLTIESTSFDSNSGGTGDYRGGNGGGLYTLETTYSVEESSFYENSTGTGEVPGSGGAIYQGTGNGTISNTTVGDNKITAANVPGGEGAGLGVLSGTVDIHNTVIAGNTEESTNTSTDIFLDFGTISSSGIVFLGTNSNVETEFPAGSPNGNGDFAGTDAAPLDALLGPLMDNGGPTPTMMPYLGSLLIDPTTGSDMSSQSTDQRGQPRISNTILDIGAVEVQPGEAQPKPKQLFTVVDSVANTAQKVVIQQKIDKTAKKIKKQKKKGNKAKAKKLGKKLKKLKAQLAALG